MKTSLIFSVFFMFCGAVHSLHSQTHYYIIPNQRFNLQKELQLNESYKYPDNKRVETVKTPVFQVSHQITVNEYQQFLQNMKKQLHDSAYQKLLPDSSFFKKGAFQEYIYSDEFKEYPIVAVTWESAIEFCRWKTISENQNDSIRFIFRLPTRHEWLAAKHFYNTVKNGHGFGVCFSDWIYDEYTEDEKQSNHYKTINKDTTETVERRLFLGKSYLMYADNMNRAGYRQYSNKTYPDIAFRCVKVQVSRPPDFFKDTASVIRNRFNFGDTTIRIFRNYMYSPEYQLLSKWNLLQRVVLEHPDTPKRRVFAIDQTFVSENDENYLSYAYYRRKRDEEHIIRVTGEVCNGKKYGDWYFFSRNGKLKKHNYYTDNGRRKKIPIGVWDEIDKHLKSKATRQSSYSFADSIMRTNRNNRSVCSSKKYFYQTKNALKDGCFLYSDYEVTVAGKYTSNSKTGMWCMWDCDGELMLQRNYTNSFDFETIYTIAPQNELTRILQNGAYSPQRNSHGYYDYYRINENDVLYEKVVWRTLRPGGNKLLFHHKFFLKAVMPHVINGEITVYKERNSGYYKDVVKVDDVKQIYNPEIHELSVFRVKEANIVDRSRCVMECRALNVYIVLKNKKTDKEKQAFWFFIPHVRKILAKKQLPENDFPEAIQTLDDFFFFRCYTGDIYSEANLYENRKLADYLYGQLAIKREQQRIEEKIIDMNYSYCWKYCTNGEDLKME